MMHKNEIEISKKAPTNTILVGAAVGAGAGVIAAMLLARRAKNQDRESMVTSSEAIQLGLLIFGLFRAISTFGDGDN